MQIRTKENLTCQIIWHVRSCKPFTETDRNWLRHNEMHSGVQHNLFISVIVRFLCRFVPSHCDQICGSTFYHQSYWYCLWFLFPLVNTHRKLPLWTWWKRILPRQPVNKRTGDPLHSRALAHSRAPLFTQPCPHCSHSRAPGEQWARLCVFTLQDCVQAARLCRGSPVKRLKDKNLFLEYVIDNKCFKRYTELLYLRCYILLQCKYNDCTWNVLDVLFFYIDRGSTVRRNRFFFFFFAKTKKKREKGK